ncbi:hypothetical protein [Lactobacillus mulieris]|nr:hypothetical protein [Lactobacillus mulieris]MCW8104252.1 hypothetical protein [Lactobacillus mulieris]MDK6802920.1 hypothetical protein [Lactobacillus mulieris]MDK8382036.1 hypothetical protein [Lactobacillus mulieris]MDT9620498.1 hypothetical protein [Lactobacillus mulieris]MDT9629396.1 hypothetical protein [Lactobacillus mulieris]
MIDTKKIPNKKPSITAEDACDVCINGKGKSISELISDSKKKK